MDRLRFRLRASLITLVLIVIVGTVVFSRVEDLRALDAFYFIVVTIASVGYGDIHPTTDAGKILAVVLIVAGAGVFVGVIATVAESLLSGHERRARMEKLHFVEGIFFSEVGTRLLALFAAADPQVEALQERLTHMERWDTISTSGLVKALRGLDYAVDVDRLDLVGLHGLLSGKRDLLLRILENPSLHEHEDFTDLLRAVFHLTEELASRPGLADLPSSDLAHLGGDVKRAYALLVPEWVAYMGYLRQNYPYLFHLSVRTNPFDRDASPMVAN